MADMNNSGATDGKVISYPSNLTNPRDYVAPSSDNVQSRGPVGVIDTLSEDAIFHNSSQGTGIAGPSVWGGPSGMSGSQSSAGAGTKVSADYSVNLGDGQNSCWKGGKV